MNSVTSTATPSTPILTGDAGQKPRESRSATVRNLLRSIKVLALLFVIFYLVLPKFAGQRESIRQLAHVNLGLLVLAFGLEFAALLCYSLLTRAALPKDAISIGTLFRVQLATKAIGNVTPAGGASSAALGYRLITRSGVASSDAGFALGAAGISSAVILNLLLWITLLISIPISGTNPLYVTVALVGVFILLSFGGLVFALLRGQEQAERLARRIAARVTFLDQDRAAALVTRLALRLREVIAARHLLRQVVLWGTLNWMLDASSLWVFLRAFGGHANIDGLLVSFCIANVFAVIPITPGGLGIVDSVYPLLLVFFGLPLKIVTLGVTSYRIAQFWLPIPIGGLMYASLRLGPWRIDREGERLGSLRSEATAGSPEPVYGIRDDDKEQ
jgi:putative heme transporter